MIHRMMGLPMAVRFGNGLSSSNPTAATQAGTSSSVTSDLTTDRFQPSSASSLHQPALRTKLSQRTVKGNEELQLTDLDSGRTAEASIRQFRSSGIHIIVKNPPLDSTLPLLDKQQVSQNLNALNAKLVLEALNFVAGGMEPNGRYKESDTVFVEMANREQSASALAMLENMYFATVPDEVPSNYTYRAKNGQFLKDALKRAPKQNGQSI
jgi:hypothetical protein